MGKIARMLSALAILCVVSLFPASPAFAVTDYGVTVQGIEVTSANASDVLSDGGSVVYVPAASQSARGKLVLTNATIKGSASNPTGIHCFNSVDIVLVGENSIGQSSGNRPNFGIWALEPFTITSASASQPGTLNIYVSKVALPSYPAAGIYCEGSFTCAHDATVNISYSGSAQFYGAYVNGTMSQFATINGRFNVSATGSKTAGLGASGAYYKIGEGAQVTLNTTGYGYEANLQMQGGSLDVTAPQMTPSTATSKILNTSTTTGNIALGYTSDGVPEFYTYARRNTYTHLVAGNGTVYHIYLGKSPVTSLNMSDILGNGTAWYVPSNGQVEDDFQPGVLTLSNLDFSRASVPFYEMADMNDDYQTCALYLNETGGTILNLVGANTLRSSATREASAAGDYSQLDGYGIYSELGLTITSSSGGTLTADAGTIDGMDNAAGIRCANLTITGDAQVTAKAAGSATDTAYGIRCNAFLAQENAQVRALGSTAGAASLPRTAVGLSAGSTVTIAGNAEVRALAGSATQSSIGFWPNGAVRIGGQAFEAMGGQAANQSYGTMNSASKARSATINSGTYTAGTTAVSCANSAAHSTGYAFAFGEGYRPLFTCITQAGDTSVSSSLATDATGISSLSVSDGSAWSFHEYVAGSGTWLIEWHCAEGADAGQIPHLDAPSVGGAFWYNPQRQAWQYLMTTGGSEEPTGLIGQVTFLANDGAHLLSIPSAPNSSSVAGDLNDNGVANVIDAQIVYDIATGVWRQDEDVQANGVAAIQRWLKADLNGDAFVDAADALVIQIKAMTGSWRLS